MQEIGIIGVDLAKNVIQLHGATTDRSVLLRKKLTRPQFQRFMAEHPKCLVVMEARGGAPRWAREPVRVDHVAKLIASRYVKPFTKRQKNHGEEDRGTSGAAQADERRRGDRGSGTAPDHAGVGLLDPAIAPDGLDPVKAVGIGHSGRGHIAERRAVAGDRPVEMPEALQGQRRGRRPHAGAHGGGHLRWNRMSPSARN